MICTFRFKIMFKYEAETGFYGRHIRSQTISIDNVKKKKDNLNR